MSIARITSLGVLASFVSCNVYHPALQPSPYDESASVTRNGTNYLVAELENPTSDYLAPVPPPRIVLPNVAAKETSPTPAVAQTKLQTPIPTPAPTPAIAEPVSMPEPKIVTAPKVEPAPKPQPKPAPVVAAAPATPEVKVEKPSTPKVVARVEPVPTPTDTTVGENFAIEFAKTLPFPSVAEISAFPQVLSPEALTVTESKSDTGRSSILLDKVRKNLARASSAKRVPAPVAIQPAAPASTSPEDSGIQKFDPAIESLSILPGDPHDERLDFGLDLGPTSTFDFGQGSN